MSDENQDNTQVENQAREMGWFPKEEFKGNPDKWVDAATYLEHGERVLPIVRATNARLKQEVTGYRSELEGVKRALEESRETLRALEEYHQSDVKAKVDKAREDLRRQLRAASESGDHEAVADITEQMTRLNTPEPETKKKPNGSGNGEDTSQPQKLTPAQQAEFNQFVEDNSSWYGKDRLRMALLRDTMEQRRASGDTSVGREFLDSCVEDIEKEITKRTGRSTVSRVEASRGGGGGGGGTSNSGKSYSDLPPEAKKECDSYNNRLVGPNRKYKDVAAWRASYAEQYFREV